MKSPYMGHTDSIFLGKSLYMDRQPIQFWKKVLIWVSQPVQSAAGKYKYPSPPADGPTGGTGGRDGRAGRAGGTDGRVWTGGRSGGRTDEPYLVPIGPYLIPIGPYWALFGPYWALFGPYWALLGPIGPYLALTVKQKRNTEGPHRGH